MTTVSISTGDLRGSLENGSYAFKGIPYAEALTGRARWLPPQPRRPWTGVRDATRYGGACTQFTGRNLVLPFPRARARYLAAMTPIERSQESDDCLLLNVWSPAVDRNAKLPVMVWIHGGGFAGGAANAMYDASRFAAQGVVAVVIQYRLGALGFLHGSGLFDGELCADNRAFLDQLLALRWVQENIERFGGDPANVTIFGESAGAFAVYQLAASPMAKGLFRRGIGMGGMAETCAPASDYHRMARDVLPQVGVKPGDGEALVSLDRDRLQALHRAVVQAVFAKGDPDRYGSLSRKVVGFVGAAIETAFLPVPPLVSYTRGTPNNVDLVLGTCANDGALFSLALPVGRSLSARMFSRNFRGLVPNEDLEALRAHYQGPLAAKFNGRVYDAINNDAFYRVPTLRAAEAHAAGHPGRTWHYQLDYASAIPSLGAIHGIDVALLFRTPSLNTLLADDEPTRQLSDLMLRTVTGFARTGKPHATGLPEWPPFARNARHTMVFDHATRLERDLDGELLAYWDRQPLPATRHALGAAK